MSIEHLYTSVFCVNCGHTVPIPVYCKNRFCPVCSNHRNRLIRWKLNEFIRSDILRKYDSYKFLTLTVKDDPDLKRMTDELIKAFRRLRQRSVWKKHVRGGACIIEVKPGKESWHVHLHIVIKSGYIPYQTLLAEWKAVSTGQGVFIKKIHGTQLVHYLTKYLTKDQCTIAEQERMTAILKGRRLFLPFGNWTVAIQAIKRLRFDCPECNNSYWGFGNLDAWFNANTSEQTVDAREPERLPSMKMIQQAHLFSGVDGFMMVEP